MSDNEMAAFIVLALCMTTTVISVAKFWFGRNRNRQLDGGGTAPALAAIDQRLSRIEQAVDTMAVEVERISEGQRFTTKLLADRGAEPALRAGSGDR